MPWACQKQRDQRETRQTFPSPPSAHRTRSSRVTLSAGLRLLEVLCQPVHDHLVKIVAAQVGIAVGGQHLANAVADLQDGDVEGAATQVKDQDRLVVCLLQPVCQGRRGGLVHNAQDVQARNLARILGGLSNSAAKAQQRLVRSYFC